MTQLISTALVNILATTIADTFNDGILEIYAGSIGTSPEDVSAGTLLVSMVLPINAFGTASNGAITMTGQWFGTVQSSGTATWARLCDPTDSYHIILTVGTSGANVTLSSVSLTTNGVVQITAFTYTVPSD